MRKMLTLYLFTIPLALSAQKNIETTERISLEGKVKTRHRNRRKKGGWICWSYSNAVCRW